MPEDDASPQDHSARERDQLRAIVPASLIFGILLGLFSLYLAARHLNGRGGHTFNMGLSGTSSALCFLTFQKCRTRLRKLESPGALPGSPADSAPGHKKGCPADRTPSS